MSTVAYADRSAQSSGTLFSCVVIIVAVTCVAATGVVAVRWYGHLKGVLAALAAVPLSLTTGLAVTRALWPRQVRAGAPRVPWEAVFIAAPRVTVVFPARITTVADVEALRNELAVFNESQSRFPFRYVIVVDLPDAPRPTIAADDGIVAAAQNLFCGADVTIPAILGIYVRKRRWSTSERAWIPWERKRGLVAETLAALDGGDAPALRLVGGADVLREGAEFALFCDRGTWLEPDGLLELLGTALAVDSGSGGGVAAIVQPDLSFVAATVRPQQTWGLVSNGLRADRVARASQDRFTWGFDVHRGACALFLVKRAAARLANAFPTERLLHHDLFDGFRCGVVLVPEVVAYQHRARAVSTQLARGRRWMKGVFQMADSVVPRSASLIPLSVAERTYLLTLIGTHLRALSLAICLTMGAFAGTGAARIVWVSLGILPLAVEVYAPVLRSVRTERPPMVIAIAVTLRSTSRLIFRIGMLLFDALIALREAAAAIKCRVSRRGTLSWAPVRHGRSQRRSMYYAVACSVVVSWTLVIIAAHSANAVGPAALLGTLWSIVPVSVALGDTQWGRIVHPAVAGSEALADDSATEVL